MQELFATDPDLHESTLPMFTEFRKSLVDGCSRSVGYVHKRLKAWPTYGNLLCKTVGESPIVFREIQVRSCGSSYAQVCTQFIQGNVPIDPIDCVPGMRR